MRTTMTPPIPRRAAARPRITTPRSWSGRRLFLGQAPRDPGIEAPRHGPAGMVAGRPIAGAGPDDATGRRIERRRATRLDQHAIGDAAILADLDAHAAYALFLVAQRGGRIIVLGEIGEHVRTVVARRALRQHPDDFPGDGSAGDPGPHDSLAEHRAAGPV